MPFKMHKIICIFPGKKNVYLPYLKFSDPLPETHLFFIWPYSDDLGSDQEAEYSNKIVSLPPTEVTVATGETPITQIACGMHHTGNFNT